MHAVIFAGMCKRGFGKFQREVKCGWKPAYVLQLYQDYNLPTLLHACV